MIGVGPCVILRPALIELDRPHRLQPPPAHGTQHALVAARRQASDEALALATRLAGAPTELRWRRELDHPPSTACTSTGRWYASLTNTRRLAAALVAPGAIGPIGLDAEWRNRERLGAARVRLGETGELERFGRDDRLAVLELWTAKEAVLKRAGVGIAGFETARFSSRTRDERGEALLFRYAGEPVRVVHFRACDHVLALAAAPDVAFRIEASS